MYSRIIGDDRERIDRCHVCGRRLLRWRPPLALSFPPIGWLCRSCLTELEEHRTIQATYVGRTGSGRTLSESQRRDELADKLAPAVVDAAEQLLLGDDEEF